jgi:hypothetical protein
MEYFTVAKHASIPAQTFISLNRITRYLNFKKKLTLDVKKSNSSNETPNVMTVGVEKYGLR